MVSTVRAGYLPFRVGKEGRTDPVKTKGFLPNSSIIGKDATGPVKTVF